MERKQTAGGFKATDGEGSFEAVFAVLNVKDRQDDVVLPGAFERGAKVKIAAWGHDWGSLAVGKGTIDANDREAWVTGQFFLETTAGRETYNVVKGLGQEQEWSFGFEIVKSHPGQFAGKKVRFLDRLTVFEVSPVMVGAGIGTHTRTIKALGDPDGARFAADSLLAMGSPTVKRVSSPADVLKQVIALGGPAVLGALLDDELLEVEYASLAGLLAKSGSASGRPTRLDVLRANIAGENGGGHSAVWVEAMLDADLRAMARKLAKQDRSLGGQRDLALAVVHQVMSQRV